MERDRMERYATRSRTPQRSHTPNAVVPDSRAIVGASLASIGMLEGVECSILITGVQVNTCCFPFL